MGIVKLFQSLVVVFSLVTLASCGKNGDVQIVKGLKVETIVENNEVKLRVASEVDFGNIFFPSLQIPVMRDNRPIGSV